MVTFSLTLSILPARSDCGDKDKEPNAIDKECNTTQCGGTENEIKGCYLPPTQNKCPEDYPNRINDICCCK